MDLIDVPQTTKLLLTLAQSLMPMLIFSLPILVYMNFINGQFAKLGQPVIVESQPATAPQRAKPCHYTASSLVPPPPPIMQ